MPGELQIQVDSLMQVFPRIPGMRIKLYPDPFREQGAAPRTVERIEIPRLMRIAARLQDLDYTAPIWVNGLALAFALHRALSPWLEKISC